MPTRLILLVCLAMCVGRPLAAQDDAPRAVPDLTIEQVEERLEVARTSSVLDDATRTTVTGLYERARARLVAAEEFKSRGEEFSREAAEAPALLATIREQLSEPPPTPQVELPVEPTVESVRAWVREAENELEQARRRVEELQTEAETRTARRSTLGERQAAARAELQDLEHQLQVAAVPEGEVGRARMTLLQTQVTAARAQVIALDQEARAHEVRAELLPARRDRAGRRAGVAEQRLVARETRATKFAQDAAERERREAEQLVGSVKRQYPELIAIGDRVATLAGERKEATARFEVVTGQLNETRGDLTRLLTGARAARRQVDAGGLTRAMGILLRQELRSLPDMRVATKRLAANNDALAEVQLRQVMLDQERTRVGDVEDEIDDLLADLEPAAGPDEDAVREALVRDLLTRRRDLLDSTYADWAQTFNRRLELDVALRSLIDETRDYRQYIEERILWVRSVTDSPVESIVTLREGLAWLFDPSAWADIIQDSWMRVGTNVLSTLSFLPLIVLLVALRGVLRRRLADLARRASKITNDSILWTVLALLVTVLLALPGPLTLVVVGRTLMGSESDMGYAAGRGAIAAGTTWFLLEFLRQVLKSDGVGVAHFRWPPRPVASIRRALWGFLFFILPTSFLWITFETQDVDPGWSAGPGRAAFIIGVAAQIFFLYQVFRRSGPLNSEVIAPSAGFLARSRRAWFAALLVIPASLIVLSLLGYHYTAIRLEDSLASTCRLGVGLFIVHALLVRWLMFARRRLLLAEHRKRREKAETATREGDAAPPPVEEDKIDVPAIDAKTRQLFHSLTAIAFFAGLVVLWSDVLPAFGMLHRVQLWPRMAIVEMTDDDRAAATSAEPIAASDATAPAMPMPMSAASDRSDGAAPATTHRITLANVIVALLFGVITVTAVRTMPALLEIAVVGRLPLDAGARYALLTVMKYVIMIGGVVISFGAIGIGWAQVQWIAAALTFGLAFGLQEIFANFISGLIILAERPVRVGDTATVQGVSGTVTRIRMRATTLADWDRKEIVIPNKAFITEQVINWSLTDSTIRLILGVGVSYEADVRKTEELLYAIVRRHPGVLSDPPAQVLFRAFGDSTLNFEVRVFLASNEGRMRISHELNMQIIEEFRVAGIEIAFPQRDLHLRSAIPVEIIEPGRRGDASPE